MIQNFKKLSLFCLLGLVPVLTAVGQDDAIKKIEQNPLIKNPSRMMADKAVLKRDVAVADSVMMAIQLEEEDEEFPADDIYSSWNSEYVNPYKSAVVPDSFRVDLSSFYMPFEGKITSNFGPRRRRFHYGTDIKLQVGDTVRAAFDGKVRVQTFQRRGYGYYLVIRHSNGLETVYGHLSKFLVSADDVVKAGDPIALGGNTGRSTGSHLHFEMRFLGRAINPQEIVDFDHFTTFDESYVFVKGKIEAETSKYASKKYTKGKYVAGGKNAVYHQIRSGDTLGKIAKRYGVSVSQLCRMNNIKTTTALKVGKTLRCG